MVLPASAKTARHNTAAREFSNHPSRPLAMMEPDVDEGDNELGEIGGLQ